MRNLIKSLFIVSLMSAPAFAATLLVPEDYPTIQDAVDVAEAGDVVMVGPGEYAGAVIDRVPVIIEGKGKKTRIVAANDYFLWPGESAFLWGISFYGADHVQLEDITIVSTLWSVAGTRSDRASVKGLEIVDSYQGIASWGGSSWTIEDNVLIGVKMYPWQGGSMPT